ncbi:copper-transporting ATPase [Haemophilus influenzae biotype aegyptius]|uniref:Copper transporter n=1 Tax=Haemophilus influenzae F3047 TaxID=935897 RepID=A0AAV2U3B1_HAEIF|nr:heavy metal translocating P-type ATPase [Haemophilus influenzae]QEQ58573.1 copper-translocating P-type ATPase [Haemophilus influenzae biotype aegyptius]QEQ61858.1 copper-translocating P-type ATPase [Haemophilus influenzae biotype aegyptius]QEQ64334.1 copper-translocating P-type ATPase [Haemophilus influenzae biotype aegyptius]QEQ65377.1 copper-translocating P-type ATPase [Haemophilus influenzae biotype aegyptius]TMQ36620.1 copper-transporting ATPase [Haemophilus influenzae biotype aegyptius
MLDLTPQSKKISIQIGGMTCQSCANRIEKVLNKKPFVQQAGVNFAAEEAQVLFNPDQASEAQIIEIIHKTGFSAHIKQANELPIEENTSIPWRLIVLWIINIPFLIGMLGMISGSHHLMLPPIWQFALASIVQLWLAIPFYRGAIGSIRGGLANMDVLVSTGTLTIYLYSAFMLFYHANHAMGHVYFEASVMVMGFVSLGKFLEERTKKHSLNSLSMLLQLTPKKVTALRNDKWTEIALDQVDIGEIIRANQGERIAADGIIESGNGWCDESHLTGESRPEEKQKGGKVLAGAMVTEGSIIYRANQLGSQTLLGDMMNALSDAQGSKAPIARFADKVASVFVPAVLVISLVTFTLTYILTNDSVFSLIHAVSVLVIACPCALGLATPAAIMVGLGKAVNAGVWFKDAAAMEETAHVDTVVLDKTGTLTKGELEISALWQPQSAVYSEEDLYRFAAAVERQANHPIAKAIVQTAEQKMLEIPTALFSKMEVGQGIQAELEQVGTIKVGKPDYCGLILPKNLEDIWQIASIVAVSINDKPIGAFALTDTLKNDSLHAIQRLQQQNIDVVIMSGDQQSVVDYIAKQLGIKKVFGGLSPRDKAEQIQKLKAQGHIVAMVGDGINDAPALAAANVSFAMKSGSDIAEQTASATLMQHSVNQLVDALFIAVATLKNIKQNLFFALIYNILGIPLAAFGFLSPIIAGAAMALSSISVLMNALRLKKVRF